MSFEEFRVDLAQMAGVIGRVKGEAAGIETAMAEIARQFTAVETAWISPSSLTFDDLAHWFTTTQDEVKSVLADMISRLNAAYETYQEMERAALENVQ
ncbi:WXG100 family type VII secretion target [Actinoplanes sp. NPDC051851]|uniref:WXG100 family type VII secretion target n=1 Tax=Actinoplanes sp. NPDC051851 TaxID=3154753 RepID=UPI00341E597C